VQPWTGPSGASLAVCSSLEGHLMSRKKPTPPAPDEPAANNKDDASPETAPIRVIARLANLLGNIRGLMLTADSVITQQHGDGDALAVLTQTKEGSFMKLLRAQIDARGIELILPQFVPDRANVAFRTELLFHHLLSTWHPRLNMTEAYAASRPFFAELYAEVQQLEPILAIASRIMADESLKPFASSDYTHVRWYGTAYSFKAGNQAESVRVLWEEWQRGGRGLSQATIGEAIGTSGDRYRIDTVFRVGGRPHPAIGSMIKKDGPGHYRLHAPALPPVFAGPGTLPLW